MVMLSLFIGTVTMSMNQSMENIRMLAEEKKKKEMFQKNKAALLANHAKEAAAAAAAAAQEAEKLRRKSVKTPSTRRLSSAGSGGSSPPRTPDFREFNNLSDQPSHQLTSNGRSDESGRSPRLSVVNEGTSSTLSNCVSSAAIPLTDISNLQIGQVESEIYFDEDRSTENGSRWWDLLVHIVLVPFLFISHVRNRKNAYLLLQKEEKVSERQRNLKKYLLAVKKFFLVLNRYLFI